MASCNWLNPYTGAVENNIMVALADHTEMKTLHMVTADPFRTPTFTPFADPDWFFFATGGHAGNLRDAGRLRLHSRRGRARASPGTTATSRTRSPRPGSATSGRGSGTSATTTPSGPTTPTIVRRC